MTQKSNRGPIQIPPQRPSIQWFLIIAAFLLVALKSARGVETEIKVSRGETLRGIARKFYGDAVHWKKIYEANLKVIPNPEILELGVKLKIPELSTIRKPSTEAVIKALEIFPAIDENEAPKPEPLKSFQELEHQ